MISADTNILVYAATPDSPNHEKARDFLIHQDEDFVLCQLVLVELYMLLRNKSVFKNPYSSREAASYCKALANSPKWRCVDYETQISERLWKWAENTDSGYRNIIDARIAFTLQHHGVTKFATANVKDFEDLGFQKVWNPLLD